MKERHIGINDIPAIIWGETTDQLYLYVHGKSGYKEEAREFAEIACKKGWQVLSIDLPEHGERKEEQNRFDPWHVTIELKEVMKYAKENWNHIALYANSIGAWFSMLSFADQQLEHCLFVSPVLDMEQLIRNMMQWAMVTEERLEQEKIIETEFGETLSWEYYNYTKIHPIQRWDCPTSILYAGRDNLTSRSTVDDFVERFHCQLTVMEEGEHWFHTPEQLSVLTQWTEEVCSPS